MKVLSRIALLASLAALVGCEGRAPPADPSLAQRPDVRRPIGPVPGPGTAADTHANPYVHDAAALMAGRQLFKRMNCAGCHGGHGGGGMGPSLRDADWKYGSKPEDIFDSIARGRALGMPAWGTKLPEKEVWELAAYVGSLATPDEPEKPH